MFESVSTQMAFEPTKLASLDDMAKARFGFYYVILQNLTPLDEFDEITKAICDQDFNVKLFDGVGQDEGIDASYADVDTHTIYIFNFKYRKFKEDQVQSLNEFVASSKFFSAIKANDASQLSGRIKAIADDILLKFRSTPGGSSIIHDSHHHPAVEAFLFLFGGFAEAFLLLLPFTGHLIDGFIP